MAKDTIAKVIDSGTSGIWTWKKFADGTAECIGVISQSVTVSQITANIFRGAISSQSLPSSLFVSTPAILATPQNNAVWCALYNMSASATGTIYIYDVAAGTVTIRVAIHAIGRWK